MLGSGAAAARHRAASGCGGSSSPHVADNLLENVPREIAAQIFMGGAQLYGFDETHFAKADSAAAR